MTPKPRSLLSRFFARKQPLSSEISGREQALLTELAALDQKHEEEDSAAVNLATVEATLKRLRAQNSVVALRPGTAPPATNGALQQRARPNSWRPALAFAGASLLLAVAWWSFGEAPTPFVKHDTARQNTEHSDTRNSDIAQHSNTAQSDAAAARLALFSGSVRVDGQPQQIAGQTLRAGSVVEVLSGRACLSFPRAISACLEQDSEVVVPAPGAQLQLEVRRGRVAAQLSKQAAGYSFSLFAGNTRALAVGTLFGLYARANGEVSVQVVEGRVQVVLDGAAEPSERHELAAGQHIDNTAAQIQTSASGSDAPYLALLAGQDVWSAAPDTAQRGAVLYVESEPAGALVRYDSKELGVTPLSVLVPWVEAASPTTTSALEHTVTLQLADHESSERRFTINSGGVHRLFVQLESSADAPSHSTAKGPALTPAEPSAATDAGSLLSRARQLLREGRWLEAANTYRALRAANPSSAEAKTVLVALGQIELDRLAQPRAAQSSFQAYLDSGGGALSQEARAGKIRALRAQGQRTAELAAIREYLTLYPTGLDNATLERRARELD